MDYIKIKNFYSSKDTIKNLENARNKIENISVKNINDKELVSRILKELQQFKKKKTFLEKQEVTRADIS